MKPAASPRLSVGHFSPSILILSHLSPAGAFEYLHTQAVARLYLDNIPNIQKQLGDAGIEDRPVSVALRGLTIWAV